MKAYNTNEDFTQLFNRANIILSASVMRADYLRDKAAKINMNTKNNNTWIKNSNKRDELKQIAQITEDRGRKVWAAITDFQGKYINWRNVTTDGKQIFDIRLNTYTFNLPIVKKLAGV